MFTGGGPREGGRGVRVPPPGSIMPGGADLLKAQGLETDPNGILPHPWLGKGKLEFK